MLLSHMRFLEPLLPTEPPVPALPFRGLVLPNHLTVLLGVSVAFSAIPSLGAGWGFLCAGWWTVRERSSEIHVSHGATHGSEESSSFGPPRSSNLKGSSGSFSHFNQS